jgi:hypothetical protein
MYASAGQYAGAWFQVWYPDNFEVTPSMASTTADKGVDSAFFRSPDGQVEFYIFSPQWSGEPSDIAIHPSREILRSKDTKHSEDKRVTWLTIDAIDGSYSRSYQDTVSNNGSVRWVVGIKYRNQAIYNRYKKSISDSKVPCSNFQTSNLEKRKSMSGLAFSLTGLKAPNRIARGAPPAATAPRMRVRTGRDLRIGKDFSTMTEWSYKASVRQSLAGPPLPSASSFICPLEHTGTPTGDLHACRQAGHPPKIMPMPSVQ